MSTEDPRASRSRLGTWLALVVCVLVVAGSVYAIWRDVHSPGTKAEVTRCKDNIKALLTHMIGRVANRGVEGWPPAKGKNFILWLVASGQLNPRNPRDLEILFCPADLQRGVAQVPGGRWGEITETALRNGTDFSECTSYMGRRNADREHTITPAQMRWGTPVIACPHHGDRYIVGYSGGSVVVLEWAEVGVDAPPGPKDDPLPQLSED